jgi:hypothetical protein
MANNEAFNLQKFIISVVIIGIILVVGIYISDEIGDTTKVENTAGTVTNESVTFGVLNAAQTLNVASLEDVSCGSVTFVANQTATGETLAVGNVTLTSGCTLLNASAIDAYPAADKVYVSYTYTYTASTDASNAADDVVDALATGTSWVSILVVVGFAVIILTMLTSGLGMAGAAAGRRDEIPY